MKARLRCALRPCGEIILACEPRVRAVWQCETHAVQPLEPTRTVATYHENCWRKLTGQDVRITEGLPDVPFLSEVT